MKLRSLSSLLALLLTLSAFAQSQVKYVFYFIGDGMGVNQINVTETYQAALKGQIRGMQDIADRLGLSMRGFIIEDN